MASEQVTRRIARLLEDAEQAFAENDWATVLKRARAVLALVPDHEDAQTLLTAAERSLPDTVSPLPPAGVTAAPAAPSTPTSFASGRYHVLKVLGEGGKKRVFLAHDTLLDRDVAFALIKTEGLDPAGRERVTREAQAMGRLGAHPHIVTVFDLGEQDGQPFMVTELMAGGDLEGLIAEAPEHRLELPRLLAIARETCQGLAFAHERGVVHRDLKPGNVWLTKAGVAKIGDFGLAFMVGRPHLTQSGTMVGTPSYMPPEQALGGEATERADLYSLGAMLYEMTAGRLPFLGDDPVAIIGQHINTPPAASGSPARPRRWAGSAPTRTS